MIGLQQHLDMIVTEAVEGSCGEDQCIDHQDNLVYAPPVEPAYHQPKDLKPLRYNLQLIRNPDGTLEWKE